MSCEVLLNRSLKVVLEEVAMPQVWDVELPDFILEKSPESAVRPPWTWFSA